MIICLEVPKNIPSLKPKQLIKLLEAGGCTFYREGKGDHSLYIRVVEDKARVVPIDMGARFDRLSEKLQNQAPEYMAAISLIRTFL